MVHRCGERPLDSLPTEPLVPYVCAWVRILDNDDNVVDLVPTGVEESERPFLGPWGNLGRQDSRFFISRRRIRRLHCLI